MAKILLHSKQRQQPKNLEM